MRKINLVFLLFFICFSVLCVFYKVWANSGYTPTGYNLVVGTEVALSATSSGWKGALANENVYWATGNLIAGGVGLDKEIYIDGVDIKGANKFIISYSGYSSNAALVYLVEIYDVVNATWRTLNERNVTLANTADTNYTYEIYDGYWQAGNIPISTPLSNFVTQDANQRVTLRIYSTYVSVARTHYVERMLLEVAVDPYYEAAGFTKVSGGAVTNTYDYTFTSDNTRLTVASNVAATSQYYFSFNNVKTYPGANAIEVTYEGAVSNVALTYDVQIYNFTTSNWENLSGTTLSNTTETTYYFAKSNVDLADYIQDGEARIGFLTNAPAATRNHNIDSLYIIVGSVNTDAGLSETSFGTETVGSSVANTRDMDSSSANSTWQHDTVATSAATFYTSDRAGTWGTNYSASSNLSFPITVPDGCAVTGIRMVNRFRSNSTANTVALSLKDYSGINAATGGWVDSGSTNLTTTITFYTTTYQNNCPDFIDSTNDLGNLRLRTSASTATATVTRDWDFAMMSIRWVEVPTRPSIQAGYSPTGFSLAMGTEAALSATSAGWKGTLANDTVYWATSSVTGGSDGLDKRIYIEGVDLKAANKLIIYEGGYVSNAALTYQVQIYDVLNATWRPLNERNTTLTNTADADRVWEIYDGYWQSGNSPVSTPLSNFVDTANNNRVMLRIYSSYTTNSYIHYMDRMVLEVAIDPYYEPAGYTKVAGGTETNTYDYTFTTDNNRITVPNVAGAALQYYLSFMNVAAYTGANTVMVAYEGLVSNVALTYNVQIYNFNTTLWENLNATTLSNTTEATYYFAKSNVTLSDYMSSEGEMRVGILTNAPALSYNHSLDLMYIIVGSVNNNVSLSETSFGTEAGGTTAANTMTMDTSSADSTWQHTTVTTSAATFYALDRAGTWATNYCSSSNLSFPLTIPYGSKITGIRLANRFRSNLATNTVTLGLLDYTGINNTTGGWISSGSTNATTTLTFYTTTYQNNLPDYIDTTNNLGNLRLGTSTSTATAAATRDWDFALMSLRYIAISEPTAAKIVSLAANYNRDNNISVRFTSESEIAVKGFQVYRSLTPDNKESYVPVGKFIPSCGGPISGKNYEVIDTEPNVNYYYILGVLNRPTGETYVGPVSVGVGDNSWLDKEESILLRNGKKLKERNTLKDALNVPAVRLQRVQNQKDVFKLAVEQDGMYRLTKLDLQTAGFDASLFDPANIKLLNQGKVVSVIAGDDYIEFYAKAIDTRYAKRNIYWLMINKNGERIENRLASSAGTVQGYYMSEVKLEDNSSYYPEINGEEHWFWADELFSPMDYELELSVDQLNVSGGSARIQIGLQGFSSILMAGNNLQKIKVYINGVAVAAGQWNGDTYYVCQGEFDATVLSEGSNILRIEVPDDGGLLPQLVLLDWVKLQYPRNFVAQNDALVFEGKAQASTYYITGFSSDKINVFDITRENRPVRLANVSVENNGLTYSARFNNRDKNKRMYVAVSDKGVRSPVEITQSGPSDIIKKTNQADYIVITHSDFLEGIKPLVEYRASQGYSVKVVTVDEIYDAFNYGVFSPVAIKDFLKYAYLNWQLPKPKYVLFVGDGTFDYKDQYQLGAKNLVPAYLVYAGRFGEGPSDGWFATFEDSALPKMMIGRLPVNDTVQLQAVIQKIINYETAGYSTGNHLLVADGDEHKAYSSLSDRLALEFPAPDQKVKLYLDNDSASAVHQGILEEINRGVSFVTYTGHGGISLWSTSRVFTNADVGRLTNTGKYPFFITLTCANGYFIYPQRILDSVGEVLLLTPDKGAAGGVFPSIVSSPEEQEFFAKGFYQAVFDNNNMNMSFGEAIQLAKKYVYEKNNPNIRAILETYNLFGDPAMVIKK
ncbi:MAG: C25 family cysteine peptidase [Candidatus Omnitrophota bacterium]|jgi:hypothetical protein